MNDKNSIERKNDFFETQERELFNKNEKLTVGEENSKTKLIIIFSWVAAILITMFSIYVFYIIARRGYENRVWLPIAMKHFPAVVGLPMATIASMFIVLVLEFVSGKIEFEILGLKFKGAAGQIIFWILCFLSIVLAIKLLWNLTYTL